MITFQCHSCDRDHAVPADSSGRRIKCKGCGAALVVPDADWELLPDDAPVPPVPPRPAPGPPSGRPARQAVADRTAHDPEPAAYKRAENIGDSLAAIGLSVGLLGALLGLAGAVWAFTLKDGGTLGVVCLVTAGGSLMSALFADLIRYVVLVIVDIARTSRAMLRN